MSPRPDVVVAGAGVMGVFTALTLQERGARVVLADPWEPGHPRGTSSSESRVIRVLYGSDRLYSEWTVRCLAAWQRWERELPRPVFLKTGVLWLTRSDDGYAAKGESVLRSLGVPVERLSNADVEARYPAVGTSDLKFALFEPESGALLSREAVRGLARLFVSRGGTLLRGAVTLGGRTGRRLDSVQVGGERLDTGQAVFACGPWLPQLFPELLASVITIHKAEEMFFGVAPGDERFDSSHLPTWVDIGAHYGVPAVDGRSFKVGIDAPGPEFDPTNGERRIDPANLPAVREFLSRRFPALADAPLVESRVCTYELTADEHLVIDRHPGLDNVLLAGGGSGHAFKLGPEIGTFVADLVSGARADTEPRFKAATRAARPWREA